MFMENSTSYLVILLVVSLLHSLFSLLTVKNKISFWGSEEAGKGISTNQQIFESFSQIITILYLIDNDAS